MVREKVTPEMNKLMKSMVERTHQIARDAKNIQKVKDPAEIEVRQRRIHDGRVWLEEAGNRLRAMKKDSPATVE